MYDYEEEPVLPLPPHPSDVEIQLDHLRITYPVVPRICSRRAHMFIWFSDKEQDPDLYNDSQRSKYDVQWAHCNDKEKIEKGVALIHIYDDEIIIGTVKTAGYMNRKSNIQIRSFIRKCLHLVMNQRRITHEPYHREIMKQFKFHRDGDFWIRYPQ